MAPHIAWIVFIVTAFTSRCGGASLEEVILQQSAVSGDVSTFRNDSLLVQHKDKTNLHSTYRFKGDEGGIPAYERNGDDAGKDAILLTGDEDKLPFKKGKRIYIVLRRNKAGGTDSYYGQVAIIRDAAPLDKTTSTITDASGLSKKIVVEWTTFDEHFVHGRQPFQNLAISCAYSVILPCFININIAYPTLPPFREKEPSKVVVDELDKLPIKTGDSSDPNENYDLYLDLEINSVLGRADIIAGMVGSLVQSTTDLVCSLTTIGCVAAHVGSAAAGIGMEVVGTAMALAETMGRKKRDVSKLVDDPLKKYPGWKTQFSASISPGAYSSHENITDGPIFYGFGNCPTSGAIGAGKNFSTSHEALDFYQKALRTDCFAYMKPLLELTLTTGVVNWANPHFEFKEGHDFLTKPILPLKDLVTLTSAAELVAFTTVHKSALPPSWTPTAFLPGIGKKPISPSVSFLTQVCLKYLALVRQKARPHMIHLTRHILHSTNSALKKVAEDGQNLEKCADAGCDKDKEVNQNDKTALMGIVQFIKRGLGPVDKGMATDGELVTLFEKFFIENEEAIGKFVNAFV
ncbi:uncharacterized protein LOC118438204 [Folsomia candida]|uniref:Uncharacterized protein n=1 Tax=Folsomia candida TaxID=158441 RepID=A0A226DGQ2_FOLCA|nr:uncharacterized protein LOC118438204 [Folsomia candida]OXA44330.1 hypothetical protein Fcan01_20888 [Folsomia candida]